MPEDFKAGHNQERSPRRNYSRRLGDDLRRNLVSRPLQRPARARYFTDTETRAVRPQVIRTPSAPAKMPAVVKVEAPITASPQSYETRAENKAVHRTKRLIPKKHSKMQVALVAMAFLVFGLGLLVNLQTLQTNHNAKAQVAALAQKTNSTTSNSSSDVPSEAKPSHTSAYAVAPLLPKYLVIPRLGVDARVLAVGVTKSGALGTPSNIYDTAWYDASARPGDPGSNGAVLIDGHVHGPTLPGVFVAIKNLQPGDTIQIVRGDNQVFTYKVVKVQNLDANTMNMGMLMASVQPGEPGLNLITCGGPFDRSTQEYTQRTAVFAVQS